MLRRTPSTSIWPSRDPLGKRDPELLTRLLQLGGHERIVRVGDPPPRLRVTEPPGRDEVQTIALSDHVAFQLGESRTLWQPAPAQVDDLTLAWQLQLRHVEARVPARGRVSAIPRLSRQAQARECVVGWRPAVRHGMASSPRRLRPRSMT